MDVMKLLILSLVMILIDTFLLTRLLNIGSLSDRAKRRKVALAVMAGMGLTGAVCYFVDLLQEQSGYLQTAVFLLAVAVLAYLIALVLRKMWPALYQAVIGCPPFAAVNCAVLGAALLHTKSSGTFIEYVACGLVGGLSLLAVGAVFAGVRQHLELMAEPPKWLRGFPIALITAVLMALAFCGFDGVRIW